jgi:hypothetical protein
MPSHIEHFDPQERLAEKAESRRVDDRALAAGAKSVAQLKRDNESFAFPPSKARIDWGSARSAH